MSTMTTISILIALLITAVIACITSCYSSEKAIRKLQNDIDEPTNEVSKKLFELCNINRESINDLYSTLKIHTEMSTDHRLQINSLIDSERKKDKIIINLQKQIDALTNNRNSSNND